MTILEKIEDSGSQSKDITIISGTYYIENKREKLAKIACLDQNAINLSNKDLSHAEQTLLRKGPSFIPTLTDTNWSSLRHDFNSFVNKLRY